MMILHEVAKTATNTLVAGSQASFCFLHEILR